METEAQKTVSQRSRLKRRRRGILGGNKRFKDFAKLEEDID
jgi:hypothetical protein